MSEIVNHKHISKATSDGKRKRYRNGPVTGYILFTSDANPKVRAENPGIPFNELSKLVIFFLFPKYFNHLVYNYFGSNKKFVNFYSRLTLQFLNKIYC